MVCMYLVYTHSLQRLFREEPAVNFVIPRSPVRINELEETSSHLLPSMWRRWWCHSIQGGEREAGDLRVRCDNYKEPNPYRIQSCRYVPLASFRAGVILGPTDHTESTCSGSLSRGAAALRRLAQRRYFITIPNYEDGRLLCT